MVRQAGWLATTYRAAALGATLLLSSRIFPDLQRIVERMRGDGGEATQVVADVAERQAVQRLADEAVRIYGGFDARDVIIKVTACAICGSDLHLMDGRCRQ